jgi:hypothetical protein
MNHHLVNLYYFKNKYQQTRHPERAIPGPPLEQDPILVVDRDLDFLHAIKCSALAQSAPPQLATNPALGEKMAEQGLDEAVGEVLDQVDTGTFSPILATHFVFGSTFSNSP